jgi:hypothetical protein
VGKYDGRIDRAKDGIMWRLGSVVLTAAVAALGASSAITGTASAGATAHTAPAPGYWEVAADGGIFTYGSAPFQGSLGGQGLIAPVVGVAATPDGGGYREAQANGIVSSFGDATPLSTSSGALRVVGIAALSNGVYDEAYSGGQVLKQAGTFSTYSGPIAQLNAPIEGIAASQVDTAWMVASDGGVFGVDGAPFYGSMGGKVLNAPIVGITATPDGGGYWLVASDGGIFSFGDATFDGSMGGMRLNAPVVGVTATPDGGGYWLVASDGGVFSFGDAVFVGSMGGQHLNAPIVGIAAAP